MSVPPLTLLFVPADRPDRIEKAIASRAHAVIVDLEDAVASPAKHDARAALPELLDRPRGKPVHVRVNGLASGLLSADLDVVAGLAGVTGVHLPKVARASDVAAVVGLLPPRAELYRLHCLIESAAGVEDAYAIASSGAEVAGIWLGEADLRSETGALENGLDWARSRIVNAAVAAGLPRPAQSVYVAFRDEEGLAASCRRGRELGHLGRAAIHPAQLEIIEQAYLPTPTELEQARATIDRLESDSGATALASGELVDAAMLGGARQVTELARCYGIADPARS